MNTDTYSPPYDDHDTSRHDATGRDVSSPVVPDNQPDNYLTTREAYDLFASRRGNGSLRTIQRKCKSNAIVCRKQLTAEGEQWFVLRSSLERHIDELEEFDRVMSVATSRDVTRPVAGEKYDQIDDDTPRHDATAGVSSPVATAQQSDATPDVVSRRVATSRDVSPFHETVKPENATDISRQERRLYVERIADLKDQIDDYKQREVDAKGREDRFTVLLDAKDKQLESKDRQFDTMSKLVEKTLDSDRETKGIIGSLQGFMYSLWPGAKTPPRAQHHDHRDGQERFLRDDDRTQS